jgi:hypothetical protein
MKTFRILSGILAASLAAPLAAVGEDAPPASPPPAAASPAPPSVSSSSSIVTLTTAKPDEVVNPLDCDRLLTVAGRELNRADPAFAASLQSSTNPYFLKLSPTPPEVEPSTTGPAPEPAVTKLTDPEKLAQLADALKASGTMGMNGVLLLVFEDRPSLRAGQIIDVTFPGEDGPTHILLSKITEKSYTLKLNDTVLPVPLHPPSSAEPASHNGAATSPPASKP